MLRRTRLLWLLPALGLYVSMVAADEPGRSAVTGLDHIPIAVRDLDQASENFRRLGFSLKPGYPHANGIRNQHAKFRDGTELELITAAEARDDLTSTYRRHLAAGDGPAFLALYAPDLPELAARLTEIRQPFKDGRAYISISEPSSRQFLFFGRRNQSPTDKPDHFDHANTAESFVGVWLAVENPAPFAEFFRDLGANLREEEVEVPDPATARVARFAEGEIVILPANRQIVSGRPIIGAVLATRSFDAFRKVLAASGIEPARIVDRSGRRSVFLAPAQTGGLWLEFREK